MVRWLRWHCPPDTGFEIRTLAVWGRARYLSVTEAPHNTDFHTWMGKKHFCFFQTAETGNRTPNSGVKGSGANHYPRAPALLNVIWGRFWISTIILTTDLFKKIPRTCSFYIIGTHSNNVLIWFTKRILGTVFCVHIMFVPNNYHSHLLKYGKTHRFSFLSFHSLQ